MLPLMYFFMTTNKKRLIFYLTRQQCYPLCFFSWRPIKNNSVTPYVFFHDDQLKTTVLPLMVFFMTTNKKRFIFYLTKTTVLPSMLFFMTTNQKQQCYSLCFFHDDQRKITVSPLMFHLLKTTVLPLMFFSWRPIKNDSVTPHVSFG